MQLQVHKLTNTCFTSLVSVKDLLTSIEKVYDSDMETIHSEYSSEEISQEYSEYVISTLMSNKTYMDNIVLFTKESFKHNYSDIKINNFIVADGLSRIIVLHNLLKTKEFILKRADFSNIHAFKELYGNVFNIQTGIPRYYLDAVWANLYSKYNCDIRKFNLEFMRNQIHVNIASDSTESSMIEYISNKNFTNKFLTNEQLSKKINFKLKPYCK